MHIVVFVTVPDEESGKKIARGVVEKRLAACVNMTQKITSLYWWEGKVQEDSEQLLIMKTKLQLFSQLEEEIRKLHPYTVPEIIGMPIVSGSRNYLNWVSLETRSPMDDPRFRCGVF